MKHNFLFSSSILGMSSYVKLKNVDLDFVLDLHAHSSLLGSFIYGNTYEDVYRYERHIVFPKLLAQNAEDFNQANTMYNRDPNKAGTARRYFCSALKESVNSYTLEVSLYGYQRVNGTGIVPYTEDAYFRLGRNVARTFFDYYKAIGLMPASSTTTSNSSLTQHHHRNKSVAGGSTISTLNLRGISSSIVGSTDEDEDEHPPVGRPVRLSLPSPILHFPSESLGRCSVVSPKHSRSLTGRKVGGGGVISRGGTKMTKISPVPDVQPSLTIIDFNQLTRGGLELATGRGGRQRRRTKSTSPSRRKRPQV